MSIIQSITVNHMKTSILITRGDSPTRSREARKLAEEFSNNEDIILLDTSLNKGVAQTREFIANLNKKPYSSKLISGTILEASNLTLEAQNTLLKTIEEPNSTSRLILTSQSEYSLLSTISSRCQKIYLQSSQTSNTGLVKKILTSKIADRLELSEKMGLEEWVSYLRSLVRKSIDHPEESKMLLVKLVKYTRFVEKVNSYNKIANSRLSKYLVVMSIPKGLKALA